MRQSQREVKKSVASYDKYTGFSGCLVSTFRPGAPRIPRLILDVIFNRSTPHQGGTIANHNPGSGRNRFCAKPFQTLRRPAVLLLRSHAWFKINCDSTVSAAAKVGPRTTAHVNIVNATTERTQRNKIRLTKWSRERPKLSWSLNWQHSWVGVWLKPNSGKRLKFDSFRLLDKNLD